MAEIHCSYSALVPLASLKAHPKNPNTHPEAQIQLLAKIISESGWRAPITVSNLSGYIVAGHGRAEAAALLGLEEVPVDYQDFESEEQEVAHLLADNRIAELSEINRAKLGTILNDLRGRLDLELAGFTAPEAEKFLVDPDSLGDDRNATEAMLDAAVELQKKWQVKRGDVWQIGAHRVACLDAESEAAKEFWASAPALDLVITDPPYGVSYQKRWDEARAEKKIANDNLTAADLAAFIQAGLLPVVARAVAGATVYCWYGDGEGLAVPVVTALRGAGLEVRQNLVWVKNHFSLSRTLDYNPQHEPCALAYKPPYAARVWNGDFNKTTTIETDEKPLNKMAKSDLVALVRDLLNSQNTTVIEAPRNPKNDLHPTMKPLAVIARLMMNSSNPGSVVADPFLGSGTTLVTAARLGRTCYGTELEERYCAVVLERATAHGLEPVRLQNLLGV